MMSPDGTLGEIPADQVQAAELAGFRIMTDDDLRSMYQRIFMEHTLIQHRDKKAAKKFQTSRKSLCQQMRRRAH